MQQFIALAKQLATMIGIKPINGFKNKLTNIAAQNDAQTGHKRASRTKGIFNITFLRI